MRKEAVDTARTARQSFQEGSYFFLLGQLPYLETTTQNNTEFTELPRKSYDLPTDFRLNPASRFFPHTEFVAVLSAVAGGHGNNVGSAAAAAVVLPRTETGALRQGDRSGGRQRWELEATIVHIRDWSPDTC